MGRRNEGRPGWAMKYIPKIDTRKRSCGAKKDGWTCTLPRHGADTKHAATGAPGTHGASRDEEPVLHEWSSNGRGFAAMDPNVQRRIAAKGGRAAHATGGAHVFSPEEASSAGRRGGLAVSKNREHMAEIGRRGGLVVSQDRDHMGEIGGLGGPSLTDDPRGRAHMATLGRKGAAARRRARLASQKADAKENPDAKFVDEPT